MKDKFKKRMVFSLLLLVLAISMSFFINGGGQNVSLNVKKKAVSYTHLLYIELIQKKIKYL